MAFLSESEWRYSGPGDPDVDGAAWHNGTFSTVGQTRSPYAGQVPLTFTGTGVTLDGDYNPNQGRFFVASTTEADTMWHWRDGGNAYRHEHGDMNAGALNVVRCGITGLPSGTHTVTFGQAHADVGSSGITLDMAVTNEEVNTSGDWKFLGDFDITWPPEGFENTVDHNAPPQSRRRMVWSLNAPASAGGVDFSSFGTGTANIVALLIALVGVMLFKSRKNRRRTTKSPAYAPIRTLPWADMPISPMQRSEQVIDMGNASTVLVAHNAFDRS